MGNIKRTFKKISCLSIGVLMLFSWSTQSFAKEPKSCTKNNEYDLWSCGVINDRDMCINAYFKPENGDYGAICEWDWNSERTDPYGNILMCYADESCTL